MPEVPSEELSYKTLSDRFARAFQCGGEKEMCLVSLLTRPVKRMCQQAFAAVSLAVEGGTEKEKPQRAHASFQAKFSGQGYQTWEAAGMMPIASMTLHQATPSLPRGSTTALLPM